MTTKINSREMQNVLIIGGGIASLAASVALSRAGYQCRVLERDKSSLPGTPVEAFHGWARPGAPQVRHSHAFLARLRNLLRDRFPDILASLLHYGAEELPIGDLLAPTIQDRSARPGDHDLVMLACRRLTFEWVLRKMAENESRILFSPGERVVGLSIEKAAQNGLPRVRGVRTASGTDLHADLVIDASGRHTRLSDWLRKSDVGDIPIQTENCGIFYCSRFFRLREQFTGTRRDVAVAADLGYVKYAIFHGDAGIFSVTLAASPDDSPLRRLMESDGFETATQAFPATCHWVDGARAEPVTNVYTMSKLENTRRSLIQDGAPLVLGLLALGDSSVHTNPLYGRGCTLAFLHASLLVDCVKNHGGNPHALVTEFEAATERELGPWYDFSCTQDKDANEIARAYRDGIPALEERPDGTVDPQRYMRALIRDGLLPSMRTDPIVARRAFRSFNMLDPPGQLMYDPDTLKQVLKTFRERKERPAVVLGPGRTALIEQLDTARQEASASNKF